MPDDQLAMALSRLISELTSVIEDDKTSIHDELVLDPLRGTDLYKAVQAVERVLGGKLPFDQPYNPRNAWKQMLWRSDEEKGEDDLFQRGRAFYKYAADLLQWAKDTLDELIPSDHYSSDLVGNQIDDPSPPLTAAQIAQYIWRESGDSAKKRARDWMKAGKLPANHADHPPHHYIVSVSALERLAEMERGMRDSSSI
jgi:hypothetical protein